MKKKAPARISPANSGGPGNDRGVDYQINYAAFQALELIALSLHQPLGRFSLAVEPRLLHLENVTRWDILTKPPLRVIEAKVYLSKHDLLQFLKRAGETSGHSILELCYGGSRAPLLFAAKRLWGLAVECGTDIAKFNESLEREQIPDDQIVLEALGGDRLDRLSRIRFQNYPEEVLATQLNFRARHLFPDQPGRLIDFLYRKFLRGSVHRQEYQIDQLVAEIEDHGITLLRPSGVRLVDLPVTVVGALAMLQASHHGLPEEVLAESNGVPHDQLRQALSGTGLAVLDRGTWRAKPVPYRILVDDRESVLCRCFEFLLEHIRNHDVSQGVEMWLQSAVALAKQCLEMRPGLALTFFQATEHAIKNTGDKQLLLDVSELCIRVSHRKDLPNSDTRAKALAQAWLCGRSWVYQRTGHLEEARIWAEKSLKLGETIGWQRNTAFANKCIGRLLRLEATQPETDADQKTVLLGQSAAKLLNAIDQFATLGEFGADSSQVGDSYCLLARTYLTMGMQEETRVAIAEAYKILPKAPTKEYFDLLILTGDYEAIWGSRDAAETSYGEVIQEHTDGDRERSEILARALSRRAANRAKMKHSGSDSDYTRAADLWHSLDEPEEAAKARWALIELESKIDKDTLRLIRKEKSNLTRCTAAQFYLEHTGNSRALARRSKPTASHVNHYLSLARKKVATDYPDI